MFPPGRIAQMWWVEPHYSGAASSLTRRRGGSKHVRPHFSPHFIILRSLTALFFYRFCLSSSCTSLGMFVFLPSEVVLLLQSLRLLPLPDPPKPILSWAQNSSPPTRTLIFCLCVDLLCTLFFFFKKEKTGWVINTHIFCAPALKIKRPSSTFPVPFPSASALLRVLNSQAEPLNWPDHNGFTVSVTWVRISRPHLHENEKGAASDG